AGRPLLHPLRHGPRARSDGRPRRAPSPRAVGRMAGRTLRRAQHEPRLGVRAEGREAVARIHVSTVIAAPPERVWEAVRDIASHVEWMQDARAIRFTSATREGVGTTF